MRVYTQFDKKRYQSTEMRYKILSLVQTTLVCILLVNIFFYSRFDISSSDFYNTMLFGLLAIGLFETLAIFFELDYFMCFKPNGERCKPLDYHPRPVVFYSIYYFFFKEDCC